MLWRVLPPPSGGPFVSKQTMAANGRQYSATPGTFLDVPDMDAKILTANGWTFVANSGPTSARPTGSIGLYPAIANERFFDTTLGIDIWFDGATWRNAAGAAV